MGTATLARLAHGIIVSAQASGDEPLNHPEILVAMAEAALNGVQTLYPQAKMMRIVLPGSQSTPFEIRVKQNSDIQDGGSTRVTVDSSSGKILRVVDPLQASSGDAFLSWQFPLHSGQAFGTAGKVFVSLFGLVPLFFAITGVAVWLKRKK